MKKRIVIKIGSSSLTNTNGSLSLKKVQAHAKAMSYLHKQGHECILISSGAVAAGFNDLGYPSRPVTLAGKQAAAAVGQGLLIEAYTEAFKQHGIITAQLLLTRDVFSKHAHYSNAYATLSELIKRSVIPIINENDSISVDELTFGDNDMLSALVSGLIHADFLIILTDINGIYTNNPYQDTHAMRYDFLPEITPELFLQAKGSRSKVGTGGMASKLSAAQTALSLGVNLFIGQTQGIDGLKRILDGKGDGTYIGDDNTHYLNKPKQWIAFHSPVQGQIYIDQGAEQAIMTAGKSLLPAGIVHCDGDFQRGEVVEILNKAGTQLAKGQVNYSYVELQKIKGMKSQNAAKEIAASRPEVIHRDRLVLAFKEEKEDDRINQQS
ncbi:glutamate 5-kinase [Pullulanibacillus camelliae]|uniref:glutamate 5-kinase n=1 Tax=Pullulanibacillus camelliae TaxID=1707096 RepID=UPI0035717666